MTTLEDKEIWQNAEEGLGAEVLRMSNDELISRTRLLDNEIKIMESEIHRVSHEQQAMKDKIKENTEKIKVNKTLPYLVSNVVEILDVDPQDEEEIDGANVDLDSQRKGENHACSISILFFVICLRAYILMNELYKNYNSN